MNYSSSSPGNYGVSVTFVTFNSIIVLYTLNYRSFSMFSFSHVSCKHTEFNLLLYYSNSCTPLHFKTLKSHTKTLKIRPYVFWSPSKPSLGGPWLYFTMLLGYHGPPEDGFKGDQNNRDKF